MWSSGVKATNINGPLRNRFSKIKGSVQPSKGVIQVLSILLVDLRA